MYCYKFEIFGLKSINGQEKERVLMSLCQIHLICDLVEHIV